MGLISQDFYFRKFTVNMRKFDAYFFIDVSGHMTIRTPVKKTLYRFRNFKTRGSIIADDATDVYNALDNLGKIFPLAEKGGAPERDYLDTAMGLFLNLFYMILRIRY